MILSRLTATALDIGLRNFPKTIRVETTNGCNAKCIICPHGQMERTIGTMSAELFDRIVEECGSQGVDTLHLHNFGEPLVDKKLPERVRQCKAAGIRRVKIFSNGALLTESNGRALIEAGLDEIKISFDGANKEEFERIRAPLKYDVVVNNIITLVRLRNEMGAKLKIEVTCNSTTDKDQTMAALAKHVDGFSFGRIHNWATWDDPAVAGGVKAGGARKPCSRVWQTFTIMCDGRVALCCLDYDGSVVLGDLNQPGATIAGIWQGERYREVRRLHATGLQDQIPACANCAKSFW